MLNNLCSYFLILLSLLFLLYPFCEIDISDTMTTTEVKTKIDEKIKNISKNDLVKIILIGKVDIDSERDIDYLLKIYNDEFFHIHQILFLLGNLNSNIFLCYLKFLFCIYEYVLMLNNLCSYFLILLSKNI